MGSGSTEGQHKVLSPPGKLAPGRLHQEEPISSRKGALQISQCRLPGCGELTLPRWELLIPQSSDSKHKERNRGGAGMCSTEEAGALFCSSPSAAAFTWPGQTPVLQMEAHCTMYSLTPLLTAVSSGPF